MRFDSHFQVLAFLGAVSLVCVAVQAETQEAEQRTPPNAGVRVALSTEQPLFQQVEEVLAQSIAPPVLSELSLIDAIAKLSESFKIPIILDRTSLAEQDIDTAQTLSFDIEGVRLTRSAYLTALLETQNLKWAVSPGYLIVYAAGTERFSTVRIYEVGDLARPDDDYLLKQRRSRVLPSPGVYGGGGLGGGGLGGGGLFRVEDGLSSTEEKTGSAIRTGGEKSGKKIERAIPPGQSEAGRAEVQTDQRPLMGDLRDIILNATPGTWSGYEEGARSISFYGTRLVIVQEEATHRKIADLLGTLRATTPPALRR